MGEFDASVQRLYTLFLTSLRRVAVRLEGPSYCILIIGKSGVHSANDFASFFRQRLSLLASSFRFVKEQPDIHGGSGGDDGGKDYHQFRIQFHEFLFWLHIFCSIWFMYCGIVCFSGLSSSGRWYRTLRIGRLRRWSRNFVGAGFVALSISLIGQAVGGWLASERTGYLKTSFGLKNAFQSMDSLMRPPMPGKGWSGSR